MVHLKNTPLKKLHQIKNASNKKVRLGKPTAGKL
jgi:hypothetical protein